MKQSIGIGILVVLITLLTLPSAMADGTFYLVPQDSTGTVSGSTNVDLMIDVTESFAGYQIDINFDNLIVDIPASGVTYVQWSGSSGPTTELSDTSTRLIGSGATEVAGTYILATLTLVGQGVGVSDIQFTGNLLSDPVGDPITNTATDGTYTIPAALEPDLVVTNIDPYEAIFVDATNVFTVHVENQGTADVTGSFDVDWEITDDVSTLLASGTETITGLNAGEEKTFDFEWKPTVQQDTHVTATADSGSAVPESNETNNILSVEYVSGTGILPLSDWGYGGDEPLTNYKSGEVVGDLIYTFGDSAYLGGYNNPWSTYTVNFNLGSDVNQISGGVEGVGGTVQEARLYMYYTWYRTPLGWPADPEQKLTMTFDGNPISTDVKYEDTCGFGTYADYKYGTFVYDVTSYVTGDDAYQAILTNDNTDDTHATGIYGMALLVIYEDGSKSLKEYHIAEGYDLLTQYYKSSSTGRYSYHVLPEDATSTFNMPEATGGLTNLFTVTHAAASSPDNSRLYFNTGGQWSDPWTTVFGSTGTDIEDVTSLKGNPNTVAFQDRGDGYSATNAILISNKGNQIDLGPDQDTEEGRHIMVPITANDLDQFYGTVEMNLSYTASAFDFVAIHSSSDSIVTACQDYSSEGILDISAWNLGGVRGDVVLATVELKVVDGAGSDEILSLTVDLFEDLYDSAIDYCAVPTTISIKNLAGDLAVSSTAMSNSTLGDTIDAILNSNGRLRHIGDDEMVISATVTDSGLGIQSVTVDLSSIGGSANTLMSGPYPNSGTYSVKTTATVGIGGTYGFDITATDNGGNTATDTTGELTVYRRGDVTENNMVDMGDAMFIAKCTVGLENPTSMNHFKFVGDIQPASDGDHTTNMGDALYIARHTVGLEPAP
ncbi:MAG: DUF3344 domain-containing protein [ANME-2 cluster archaeon]|nr:MAG: DUF3344 domain-containing protein [ANME-2 cluster archaeon]